MIVVHTLKRRRAIRNFELFLDCGGESLFDSNDAELDRLKVWEIDLMTAIWSVWVFDSRSGTYILSNDPITDVERYRMKLDLSHAAPLPAILSGNRELFL